MTEDGAPPGRAAGDVVTRPIGFAADEPVIRRVGDREAYLGNVLAADPDRHDHEFEQVVTATEDPQPATTHHHPLIDGPGNEWAAFAAAVDAVRECLRRGGATLVHCKAGVSRSSTLLAAAIAAEEGLDLRAAMDEVRAARPVATPHPQVYFLAVVYLAAQSGSGPDG